MGSGGRNFVLANVNGKIIPFYKSRQGTDGKIAGDWYPFFGNTGNWLVKGSIDKNGKMNYSKEIDRITELLNANLRIPDYNVSGQSISGEIPGIKGFGVANMFPEYLRLRLSYTDPVHGMKRRNGVVDALRNNEKTIDGVFVENITGIDASDVVNGSSKNGWRSGRDHINEILRELGVNNESTSSRVRNKINSPISIDEVKPEMFDFEHNWYLGHVTDPRFLQEI